MNAKLTILIATLVTSALLVGCNSDTKPNAAPQIGSNSFVTETDITLMDRIAAQDANGDMLAFALLTQPLNGIVELASDGNFTYTPAAEFTGADSFSVSASDGQSTAQGMVSIVVNVATVSFLSYSRAAFEQQQTAMPLAINGRDFTADADAEADYADLLTGQ